MCSLPATCTTRSISSWYNNQFQEKSRELGTMINHFLLLLHLYIPLLFLSFLIPEMFRNIFFNFLKF